MRRHRDSSYAEEGNYRRNANSAVVIRERNADLWFEVKYDIQFSVSILPY